MQNQLWLLVLLMTSSLVFGAMPAEGSTGLDRSLLDSARDGDFPQVARLLRLGANPNARNHEMVTALMFAAESGNIRILHLLMASGARDERDKWGRTALMYAVLHEQPGVAAYLISAGADKNVKGDDGRTALGLAGDLGDASLNPGDTVFCRLLDGSKEESAFYPEHLTV